MYRFDIRVLVVSIRLYLRASSSTVFRSIIYFLNGRGTRECVVDAVIHVWLSAERSAHKSNNRPTAYSAREPRTCDETNAPASVVTVLESCSLSNPRRRSYTCSQCFSRTFVYRPFSPLFRRLANRVRDSSTVVEVMGAVYWEGGREGGGEGGRDSYYVSMTFVDRLPFCSRL